MHDFSNSKRRTAPLVAQFSGSFPGSLYANRVQRSIVIHAHANESLDKSNYRHHATCLKVATLFFRLAEFCQAIGRRVQIFLLDADTSSLLICIQPRSLTFSNAEKDSFLSILMGEICCGFILRESRSVGLSKAVLGTSTMKDEFESPSCAAVDLS